MSSQTIELDCEPGVVRPDALIGDVIEGTGLKEREPTLKWFGNYTWEFPEVPADRWKEIQTITKPRIEALYHAGRIRYGSW